jgi:hypothetical protein
MRTLGKSPGWRGALYVALAFGASAPAFADTVDVTYSAAGQTAPDYTAICASTIVCVYGTENFTGWAGVSPYSSSFRDGPYYQPGAVSFSGSYAAAPGTTTGPGGEWISLPQNEYGGVSGQTYPELYGSPNVGLTNLSTYTLTLSSAGVPGTNYFGVWISALDPYNDLKLYDGSTVVAEFNSANLVADLGSCASGDNPYCGNPTPEFKGDDPAELFAYVNVFDLDGYITSVQFSDNGDTGFESSNDAVAYVDPIHETGTPVVPVPEPGAAAVFGVGLLGLAAAGRGRARRAQA